MGKSGFKRILIDVSDINEIEFMINTARKKARGLDITVQYQYGKGLEIHVRGPSDRISQYEYELRTALDNVDQTPDDKSDTSDDEASDDDEDSDDDADASDDD
jgi:hypothetical protein